jgi:hypothetical protein
MANPAAMMDSWRNRWPALISTWIKVLWIAARFVFWTWHELHAGR